jgi:hypothetical protein
MQGVGWRVSSFLLRLLQCLRRPAALPRLLHHEAIKLVVALAQPTSSCTISHHLSTSFPTIEKKEK